MESDEAERRAGKGDAWEMPRSGPERLAYFAEQRLHNREAGHEALAEADSDGLAGEDDAALVDDRQVVRWPWPRLDALVGGLRAGTVHYVVGFSGMGKSTFIRSAILDWARQGTPVDVLPLETTKTQFVQELAAQALGYDPGEFTSGDCFLTVGGEERWEKVKKEMQRMRRDLLYSARRAEGNPEAQPPLAVHGAKAASLHALQEACEFAARRGSKLVIVDHIDHISEDADYASTVKTNRGALRLAQQHGLALLLMSQANQQALLGSKDYLAKYAPLRDNHVLGGGTKRQIATSMLSLFRPLRTSVDVDTLKRAQAGKVEPHEVLAFGQMGVSLMKSRAWGAREGKRVVLGWVNGSIVNDPILQPNWHGQ